MGKQPLQGPEGRRLWGGELKWREWEQEGQKRQAVDITAFSVVPVVRDGDSRGGGQSSGQSNGYAARSDVPADMSDFRPRQPATVGGGSSRPAPRTTTSRSDHTPVGMPRQAASRRCTATAQAPHQVASIRHDRVARSAVSFARPGRRAKRVARSACARAPGRRASVSLAARVLRAPGRRASVSIAAFGEAETAAAGPASRGLRATVSQWTAAHAVACAPGNDAKDS